MEKADKIKIGYYIRQKRDEKGLSQQELAEMVGVSVPTISSWENGKSDISRRNLVKLAEALGVTTYDIIAGEDQDELSRETKEKIANRFMALDEKVDEVEDNSLTLEDRIIMVTDIAKTALGIAFIAMGIGIWGAFPHTVMNLICSIAVALFGIGFMIFGRTMIKIMEKQLQERKEKRE